MVKLYLQIFYLGRYIKTNFFNGVYYCYYYYKKILWTLGLLELLIFFLITWLLLKLWDFPEEIFL